MNEEQLKALLDDHLRSVSATLDQHAERFAREARDIHEGKSEERGIYGEASPKDAKALADEGIEFHPLPILPEDRN